MPSTTPEDKFRPSLRGSSCWADMMTGAGPPLPPALQDRWAKGLQSPAISSQDPWRESFFRGKSHLPWVSPRVSPLGSGSRGHTLCTQPLLWLLEGTQNCWNPEALENVPQSKPLVVQGRKGQLVGSLLQCLHHFHFLSLSTGSTGHGFHSTKSLGY